MSRRESAVHDALLTLGWTFTGTSGGSHREYRHPDFGRYTAPTSTSDVKSTEASLKDIARIMGISMAEVKRRCGASHRTQEASVRKARRLRNKQNRSGPFLVTAPVEEEERPQRDPGCCDHGIDWNRQCFECGRTFDDLPKLCEHYKSMDEPCGRCHREAPVKAPTRSTAPPPRRCDSPSRSTWTEPRTSRHDPASFPVPERPEGGRVTNADKTAEYFGLQSYPRRSIALSPARADRNATAVVVPAGKRTIVALGMGNTCWLNLTRKQTTELRDALTWSLEAGR